jgi:hypothetical protein
MGVTKLEKEVLRMMKEVLRGGCQDTEPCVISQDIRGGMYISHQGSNIQ